MKEGSIVVLVKAFNPNNDVVKWASYRGVIFPTTDTPYTVRNFNTDGSHVGIRLEEIHNPKVTRNVEPAFDMEHFREITLGAEVEEALNSEFAIA